MGIIQVGNSGNLLLLLGSMTPIAIYIAIEVYLDVHFLMYGSDSYSGCVEEKFEKKLSKQRNQSGKSEKFHAYNNREREAIITRERTREEQSNY